MTTLQQISLVALALLLGAQAGGKLFDMRLYITALGRFRAIPPMLTTAAAIAWVGVELAAFLALGISALIPIRILFIIGASAAVIDALAYAALTIGTKLRGIEVLNCTCFGAFLPQRLSAFVLLQDIYMVAWTLWMLQVALRFGAN